MIHQNKPAVVTAAASGMARAGMKLFVREGASVSAVDINAKALGARAKAGKIQTVIANLSRTEDMNPASTMRPTS